LQIFDETFAWREGDGDAAEGALFIHKWPLKEGLLRMQPAREQRETRQKPPISQNALSISILNRRRAPAR
jgi:hypothetical protein